MSEHIFFGPEAQIAHSKLITALDGRRLEISGIIQNNNLHSIDFSFVNNNQESCYRLSLNQTKLLIQELNEVVNKIQMINYILLQPSSNALPTQVDPSPSIPGNQGIHELTKQNWNQSPFRESSLPLPSEELQHNQLPRLKQIQHAFFTREHLELCIQALQQPGVELEPSVLCPTQHLEELLLRGFNKRSIITSEIHKTLKDKKINYVKEDLRQTLENLIDERKITKQQRVSRNQREYTVYNFGKSERRKSTLSDQLEEVLLGFKNDCFTYQEYLRITEEKKIDLEIAERYFEERRQEGDILEPKEGQFKYFIE